MPKTYLRKSRTYEKQEEDRKKWDHRNTKAYKQRAEVNEFIKKQRISQEHFNQIEVDEDVDHDIEKYGCPPVPEPETPKTQDIGGNDNAAPSEENNDNKDDDDKSDKSFESASSTNGEIHKNKIPSKKGSDVRKPASE